MVSFNPFVVEVARSFPGYRHMKCVKLGVLMEAKFNLLCLDKLTKAGWVVGDLFCLAQFYKLTLN